MCYTDEDIDDAPCSENSFLSPLIFLSSTDKKDSDGKPLPLEKLEQVDIDKAWDNFYVKSPAWEKLKILYNLESFIEEDNRVHAMRSFMIFGFPI